MKGFIASVALGALVLASSAGAAGPTGNGRIALVDSEPTGGPDVYTVEPDGSGRARLTFDGRSLAPVFSPDGSRIAFLKTHPPALDLYVMNADGAGGARLLATHPEAQGGGNGIFSVVWSPDGTRIAYLLSRGASEELHVVDARDGSRVPLSNDEERKTSLAWSPDGALLAYAAGQGPFGLGDAIHVKPLAGGPSRRLVDLPGADLFPAWSTDGRWIAWSNRPPMSTTGAVYVAAPDGTGVREVGRPAAGYPGPPQWSPDSQSVLFDGLVSSRPGPRDIPIVLNGVWRAPVAGGGARLVREHVSRPRWSPDGMRVLVDAYGSTGFGDFLRPGVFVMEADGSCLTFVTSGTSADWQPVPGASASQPARCVDLVLTASAPNVTGLRGVPYSITVRNEGTIPATGVRLQLSVDVGVRFFVGRARGARCSPAGSSITCRIDELAPGSTVRAQVLARPTAGGAVQTRLAVSSGDRDVDPASNEASLRTRVFPCWIAGTDFRDTLAGTRAGERICARAGNDLVRALGGNDVVDGGWNDDVLIGGAGRDRLIGGRGDDWIGARDGERDTVECGWGVDEASVDRVDRVLGGCERVFRAPRARPA